MFTSSGRFYVWEIMHATIRKMSKQVDKLQQDVEDAKDKLDAAKRKVNKIDYFVLILNVQEKGMF